MHPIAFTVFGKDIHWYGVCIAVGFLFATGILLYHRNRAKMSSEQIFDCAMLSLFFGILGARIFYVIQFWNQYFAGRSIWNIFRIDHGGLVFYGGFLTAITAVVIYAFRNHLSFLNILDISAPAIAAGHAFGRIGCFLEGCCFGKPVSNNVWFSVVYPYESSPANRYPAWTNISGSLPLYPVQLFESAANFLLCVLLITLLRFEKRRGCVAGIYMVLYAVIRFLLEFFRGDHTDFLFGMTPSQNIALFFMMPQGIIIYVCSVRCGKQKIEG